MPENLDWKPVVAPASLDWKPVGEAPEPSILSETLKAPARVIGGFAQEAGEMAQYATGDRVGMGIRKWGEGVQEKNAQTPAFREAHPVLSTAGDVAESVAKMAPYLAADVALSAVAPEAGLPAAAGLVARGIRAAKAAPFATTVLPAVAGLAQGQRSYEKGVANGLTPGQALSASYAPAAVTGAGMAAMGAMSEGLQGVGGAAKSLKGQFVKHAAADTAIMMGQGVATTAAEKGTGIDPNAKPLDQLKDPKAWLNAALTGGMFAGLGVAKKGLVAKALKDHLDTLHEAAPEERVASVEALSQAVHPEDPAAQAAFQADTLDKIQAGEPVISEEIINKLTKETPETTRESVEDGLKASVESGGEINPIEAHNAVEEAKVVEALKSEAPATQAEPSTQNEATVKMMLTRDDRQQLSDLGYSRAEIDAMKPDEGAAVIQAGTRKPVAEDPSVLRAKRWLKDGFTEAREGSEPDAEVAAHLDDMGYTLVKGERSDRTSGGNVARREWRVEKKSEPVPPTPLEPSDWTQVGTHKDYTLHSKFDPERYDLKIEARDKDGNVIGDAAAGGYWDGVFVPDSVHVDEAHRRAGVASAMYDAFSKAAPEGAKIDYRRADVLTDDGKSFRDSYDTLRGHSKETLTHDITSAPYVSESAAPEVQTPAPQAKALADGEVRKLSDREAIARQGDTLILGSKNAEGGWDHVAKADLHKDGHFEVSASESETPEAAARMVSVLRELRMNRAEGTGLSKAEVEDHLSEIVKNLKVPVEVVNHAGEISGLREDAPKFNGAFHNGKIYLNAEHLTSLKEAEHVLLKHELAHAGLRGALGEKGLNEVLTKAWGDVNSGVREFAKEKGIETRTKAGKLEATEEYLVHLAEQGTKHPLWDKFVVLLKQSLRKLGFDMKYSDAELRSLVVEAARSMTSAKAEATATRLSRVVADTRTPDAADEIGQETTTQVIKRVLSDISGNTWRAIMPIDKTIKMAQSIPTYTPIRENLTRLQELRRFKEAAGTAPSIEAKHITDDVAKVVKTEKDLKTYNDLTHKATLYELHADPTKPLPWTEKTWKEAGKQKQTGLSLGQAVKEVRSLWAALTPAQREVQQRAVAHMKELKKEHIEAQLDVLKLTFPEDTFGAAEKVAETLHKEMWKAEQIGGAEGAGMKRAELSTTHGADVLHLAEQIAAIKHEGHLKGDYAPLMRFGDHIVSTFVKTAGGEGKRLEVRHFETKGEAMAEVRRIQADPTKMARYDRQAEAQRSVVNIPLEFLNKMQAAMDAKGIDPAQQEALMQDFKSARLSTMPRNSLEGNRLNREGIAGYEDSAVRSYAAYVQRASRTIANLKYGTKIDQTFRDMDNNIKAYQDPEKQWDPQAVERMASLKDNLYTLEKQHNTEKINEITKAIGKTTFLWYLSSPSVWAVQWSQPFVTTIPKMASRYGFGKAFGAYVSEAKNFTAGHFSDEKIDAFDRENGAVGRRVFDLIEQYREAATKEEKAKLSREMKSIYDGFSEKDQKLLILKVMSHQGAIDLSAAHSLHDLINSTDVFNKGIDYLVDKGGVFMRASETGSRRAAAVSAFRMALEDGKDFMKANDYASHIIDDTLFDFSSQNRAAIMKGNVGRVVGQFQFFRLHMLGKTIQLAKDAYKGEFKGEARKELAYMMGTSMALAGAGGTPLAMLAGSTVSQAIWDAASYFFSDPDDPWDPKADFESAMKDAVGEGATNTFMKGLPYLMGVDVSKRIGLGGMANVIQGEVPPGASPTDRANWYAAKLLGPSWGLVTDGMKTFDALGNGDYGTAMQAGSPKVLRDFMKAYDVSQDGVRGPGGRTVLQAEDVNPFSVALQMVGINPSDISLAQEEAREFKNATTELKQRRSLLMKRVTDATLAGDMDARESALADVNAWGEKQPALKISVRELANSVKRGMDLKAGKMSKQDERLKEEGL